MISNRLPRVSGRDVVSALERSGFHISHVRGSQIYLRAPDAPRLVTVPVHGSRDVLLGTLRSILRQAELTAEELNDLLPR